MKKTLIALALASTAVSGSAMAWTEGSTGGDIEFGGTVTKLTPITWLWKLGAGKLDLNGKSSELTDADKKLTITATSDISILVGKTKAAYTGMDFTGNNTMPNIEFLSAGSKVTPVFAPNGAVTLAVKMFDAQAAGTELGTLTLNAKVGALQAGKRGNSYTSNPLYSSTSNDGFFGGIGNNSSMIISGLADNDALIKAYGGVSLTELESMVNTATGHTGSFTQSNSSIALRKSTIYSSIAAGYGFGVPSGNTLEAAFTAPITTTTQWKAPITVAITYI
ncbi:TPA: hypothetical protein N2N29_001539 [Citrobacter werkmanii]|nr:hypothetical protein [Citrobacter werkmanii]